MDEKFLWWRDGVIYQIYPRSFADSNDDGIGDLKGIISKLDYLADLGVDGLWLSPINPSPDKDFGYDVADYFDIDPKFGTMDDFKLLIEEAHKRGLHIIMDLVLNHTSDQNEWFKESRSSKDNPKRDWYLWRDKPNNWRSVFGGPGWQFDEATNQYYFHMFVPGQPDLNWRNPEVYQKMMDVFHFWLDRGVDGFRLDVFNEYFKDAQFRDNPRKFGIRAFDAQQHVYDVSQPEMFTAIKDIRGILDSYQDRYVVGETFLANTEQSAQYIGENKLHAGFNFDFLFCPWNPERFLNIINKWDSLLSDAWPNYVLNNHDQPRSASRYGQGEDDERLKVAAAMLLTLRGTPFLYYGEEIGMRNTHLKRSELQDPVGIRFWPLPVGRDGCRSPMQWNSEENAGFGKGKPWNKVHANYTERNVEKQKADPRSLFNFYKRLLTVRKTTPTLQKGSFVPLTYEPRRLLAYLRQDADQTVLIALNFGRRKVRLALGPELRKNDWQLLLSNKRESVPAITPDGWMPLMGNEASIYIRKNSK
jgi:alpha-glucosidase